MKLTVQDICNFPELEKLTLIAGKDGLTKEVAHCGILDYEYDKDVSNKYYDYNYQMDGGFLTLTTFLYAKNDPNLIYDAVRKLVAKKGSGLIIKNIFKLPISSAVIKYANRMDFPIFVLNDSYPFFEDIIVSINKAMEKYDSVYYREQKVRSLLDTHEDDRYTTNKLIQEITPSLKDKYICLRFKSKFGDYSAEDYIRTENILYQKGLIKPEDSPFYYDNGSLIIISRSNDFEGSLVDEAVSFIEAIDPDIRNDFFIGLSREHSVKWALSASIKESTYAASFHSDDPAPFMEYGKLGTYQAILPNAREFYMHNFSQDLIAPLEKYDIEKHSEILKTTIEFVKSGGNLDKTSEKLCQHKNTIRNRLKKAGEILNLNPFDLGDYESLALAVRIHICSGK